MAVHGHLKGRRVRHTMWPDWLVGNPDVFIQPNVVVFVNGCFWHGCPEHYKPPRTNRVFWRSKISRNMVRQREVVHWLERNGWRVRIVWEHELRRSTIEGTIDGLLKK